MPNNSFGESSCTAAASGLVQVRGARENNLKYAVDIYPMYGSDADASLAAGHNFRHALIGPGVFASHGYERTHVSGLDNTLKLLVAFVTD